MIEMRFALSRLRDVFVDLLHHLIIKMKVDIGDDYDDENGVPISMVSEADEKNHNGE